MKRTSLAHISHNVENEVLVAGWVDARRDHGKLIFLDLRDATGTCQIVVSPGHTLAYQAADLARPEWVLQVRGTVRKRPPQMINPHIPTGDVEIDAGDIDVVSRARELPFALDENLNLDTYFDHLPLTLRRERSRAIFRVQAAIIQSFREFLTHEHFVEFQAPKIIGEDAEGGASVFSVDYFGKKANLAQSPQFYKQIMVGVYERVFTTGNVYRAEKHSTSRHVNEYTSLDMEMGFIEDHRSVMDITGYLMNHIVRKVEERCAEELKIFATRPVATPEKFPSLKLREAQALIKKEHGENCLEESDLSPQHERWLGDYAMKEFDSDFLFVTHFPVEKRPFYVYEDADDPGFTKSFDLLFRGLEIATGGQRIHEYDSLVASIRRKGLLPEKFSFFLQAFTYGMPPHGGFGMGLERLTARFLGLDNVKEAVLFPRDMNRIDMLLSRNTDSP